MENRHDDPLLHVQGLRVVYKTDLETVCAVNGVDFSLRRGETLGLVGETGAGKTTTALALMRLLPERTGRITGGRLRFNGADILALSEPELRQMRGARMAMIFQDPMTALNPVLTVGDQIAEALLLHSLDTHRAEIEARVTEALTRVGIPPARRGDYPHQFSGGMRQRVVIAMALACQPDLIIADEPTTALDVTIQAQVLLLMRRLRDSLGTAMIMITHDLGIVAQTCDNVAIMYAGRIIELGGAREVFLSERRHPYTEGLFGSIPSLRRQSRRLSPIAGLMPDPTALPPGCPFAPRCPRPLEACARGEVPAYQKGGHRVCCHHFAALPGYTPAPKGGPGHG